MGQVLVVVLALVLLEAIVRRLALRCYVDSSSGRTPLRDTNLSVSWGRWAASVSLLLVDSR